MLTVILIGLYLGDVSHSGEAAMIKAPTAERADSEHAASACGRPGCTC